VAAVFMLISQMEITEQYKYDLLYKGDEISGELLHLLIFIGEFHFNYFF